MPDQAPKKKNAQNLLSNLKSTANQDDKTVKENDTNQKQCSFDCEDAGIPAVDIQEENSEKGIEEIPNRPPKPMYDAMRVEPVLTNLIVERYEGSVDENGFFEGDSTIFFVGGHWYKGLIKDKKMNGQGTYCWSDGTMYKGEFCNNTIAGSGIYFHCIMMLLLNSTSIFIVLCQPILTVVKSELKLKNPQHQLGP